MSELSKTAGKALGVALRILGHRSCTVKELETKMLARGYPAETVAWVIEYCLERNYLNDREFARQWISTRTRLKPMGKCRLKQELKQKGLDQEVIYTQLEELLPAEIELDLATELLSKKLHGSQPLDKKKKYQLYRMLLRRGFSGELARQAICRVTEEAELPELDLEHLD
ncbi:regulatory protein RecX [Zhaonella formicivorans]|jgi:regulatory protein|uniref:regulatory protein RecX n=1 Tax=Zhaonella formicivorans TaxID=2528593 RepID=UPI0010D25044|nr:regulatory protein RecX [Zhaonella formicivorans]